MQTHDNEPTTGESALRRGISAARAGLRSLAATQFERAAESSPDDPNVWLWLAWVANSPDNAIRCLERVLELSPDNSAATAGLIWARSLSQDTPLESLSFLSPPEAEPVTAVVPEVIAGNMTVSEREPVVFEEVVVEETVATDTTEKRLHDVSGAESSIETVAESLPLAIVEPQLESPQDVDSAAETSELPVSSSAEIDPAASDDPPLSDSTQHRWSDLVPRDSQPLTNATAWPSLTPPPLPSMMPPPLPSIATSPLEVTSADVPTDSNPTTRSRFQELFAANSRAPLNSSMNSEVAQEPSADVEELANSFNPSASEVSQDGRPLVMIVDDSPTVRKLVSLTLERRGFRVISAFDGVAAIKELGACRPDLILLDINMPRLDGYRLCKLIKKHEATQTIPVVMLSGKDGMFDKLRGRLVGCSDYITKPFEADALTHKVAKYLSPATTSS